MTRYRGSAAADRTASLGLLYDWTFDGAGLRVAEIIEKGPFGHADTRMNDMRQKLTISLGHLIPIDPVHIGTIETLLGFLLHVIKHKLTLGSRVKFHYTRKCYRLHGLRRDAHLLHRTSAKQIYGIAVFIGLQVHGIAA